VAPGHEEVFPPLIERLQQMYKKDAVYTEFWNMVPPGPIAKYFRNGFSYLPHYNFFVDLSDGREQVLERISRSTRKHLKTVGKNNLEIKPVESDEEFDSFYRCLEGTYRRVRVPLIDRAVFQRVYEGRAGLFLLARHQNNIIASRVVLTFGNEIYDWYAGEREGYSHYYPNENLVWWVLEYGMKNGYKWFNFGGAGKPGQKYGPREFKRRFGGTLVEYGRFKQVNRKFYHLLTRVGIRLLELNRKAVKKWGKK
jgi:lipid II:glycine glycyltransferase (peptidoglycan interpeptide bridge formation enzyme)